MAEMSLPEGAPVWLWCLFVLAPVLVALIGYVGGRKNRQDIKEVKEHVANTHNTNLREDIDKIIDGMRDIKAVQFEQGRKLECMSDRIDTTIHKVDTYRKAAEEALKGE